MDTESLHIIKNEEEKIQSDKITDVGLTADMVHEIFRSSCDIMYILNLDNGKAIFNYVDEQDFTTKVPETINDFVTDKCVKIHEEDLENVLTNASRAVKSEQEVKVDFRMLSKDGVFKEYEQKLVPIRGAAGNVSHLMGFINHKLA